jgi:hypothetical protein
MIYCAYLKCKNMGEIVKLSLKEMLRHNKVHTTTGPNK